MRFSIACVATFATTALAHYNFEKLIVNDEVTGAYEYVRKTTNSNSPITDVTSQDFICNAGGLDAAIMSKTSTHTVKPGDSVGFTINTNIGHPGPLHVYMSKAPGSTTAQEYKGNGDWFKVYSLTTMSITDQGLQWATYVNGGLSNFTFNLPQDLPAGEYLMRAEHIGLHGASALLGAQYYLGCAQLKVEGSGTGTPTNTVSIPGVYDGKEPGVLLNIYYPVPKNYTDPGPITWPNGCEDHTANFVGQTSDGDCTGSTANSSSSGSASASGSGSGSGSGSTSGSGSGSSSGAGSKATGSGSGAGSQATGTTSGAGSKATGSSSVSAAGTKSGSSSSSGSSGSGGACTSKGKRRAAYKKRADQNSVELMRD